MDFKTLYKKNKKNLIKKTNIVSDLNQRIKLYKSANEAKSKTINDCKKKMKEAETEILMLKFIIIFLFVIIIYFCEVLNL